MHVTAKVIDVENAAALHTAAIDDDRCFGNQSSVSIHISAASYSVVINTQLEARR